MVKLAAPEGLLNTAQGRTAEGSKTPYTPVIIYPEHPKRGYRLSSFNGEGDATGLVGAPFRKKTHSDRRQTGTLDPSGYRNLIA